jgi:hypothetical protein
MMAAAATLLLLGSTIMTEPAHAVVTSDKIERVRVDHGDSKSVVAAASKVSSPSSTPAPKPTEKLSNPGDTKNCKDFSDYREAKAWYDTYFTLFGDVARLDGDGDGVPCESLPGAPKKTK